MAKGGEFILPESDLSEVFSVADLTEDHRLVRQMMSEFMANEILPKEASDRIENKDFDFTLQLMKKLAELGVVGAEIPEEFGGSEMDKISGAIIAEEVGRQGSFACTFLAHTGIGTLPIKLFGTKEQKEKYLPQLAGGEVLAAYSLTETEAGSDANAAKTTAIRVEGGFRLDGSKIFVTNGSMASVFTVFAKLDGGLTAFIVEKGFEGVVVGKEEHKMGIQGSSTTSLNLNNVFVPKENLLGEEGKGLKEALHVLNFGRFKLGAACLGGAKLCLDESVEYSSKKRKQFGVFIGSFGAIQQQLSSMAAKIYGMEAMVYRTAGHLDSQLKGIDSNNSEAVLKAVGEFVIECSLVKVICSEFMLDIAEDNLRVHGGNGFMKEYPAERHLRDAVINTIFEGTNPINRLVAIGMALKKAQKNELPLVAKGKEIQNEMMSPSIPAESDDLVDVLAGYLKGAKKCVILAAGMALEKHGARLNDAMTNPYIQILLLNLADCLAVIYLLDSSLAALAKSRNEHNENLVRVLFTQQLFELERLMKETLPMCGEGDVLRTLLAASRRFLKFTPDNMADLYTKIALNLK